MIKFKKTISIFFSIILFFILFAFISENVGVNSVVLAKIRNEYITVAQYRAPVRKPSIKKPTKLKKTFNRKAKNPLKKTFNKKAKNPLKLKKAFNKKAKPAKLKKAFNRKAKNAPELKKTFSRTSSLFSRLRYKLAHNKLKNSLSGRRISLAKLKSIVPNNNSNKFVPSKNIKHGQKYQFTIHGQKVEVKFHSPDKNAAKKHSGSNSGKQWTAQIKVGNKLLGSNGNWFVKPNNRTHIPIKELPYGFR